jgi:hypothetical protein
MSASDVQKLLGEPKLVSSVVDNQSLLYRGHKGELRSSLYTYERVPYDLLKDMPAFTPYWLYPYAVNSLTSHNLRLFFDSSEKLKGWIKEHSELTRDKFMHERLTSQLRIGMSRADVRRRIGMPDEVRKVPKPTTTQNSESQLREFHDDTYWSSNPVYVFGNEIEVYSYTLPNGQRRHVFLSYNKYVMGKPDYPNVGLDQYGYDHAWEEVERYLAEKASRK